MLNRPVSLVFAVVAAFLLAVLLLWNAPSGEAAINTINSPDTTGNVGEYTSLVLNGSGYPVVSYYDVTSLDLKVVHCGNATCSSGNTITAVDTGGSVGQQSSLVLDGSGFPVVSYLDSTNGDLKVLHCGNAVCGSGNTINSPDTTGNVGEYTSVVLNGSGYPVVSYYDVTSLDLNVLVCGDAACSSGNTITSVDTTDNVGQQSSLVLDGSGFPVVGYYDLTSADLNVVVCGNAACSSGNTITSVDTTGDVGIWTSLVLDGGGFPVVSYSDSTNADLKVLHCGEPNCGGSPTGTLTINKDFTDDSSASVNVTVTCDNDAIPDPVTQGVTESTPAVFTIYLPSGTANCDAVESPAPTGYIEDNTACQDVSVAASGTPSCTITNTNFVPFTVSKDFSDDSTASVDVTVTCDNSATPDTGTKSVTESTPAVFTISLPLGAATCDVVEAPAPAGYIEDNTACQNVVAPISSTPSCTITNTSTVLFKVYKLFDKPTSIDVPVTLVCTPTPVSQTALDPSAGTGDPAEFQIDDFDLGVTCTATESVPLGWTADESHCLNVPINEAECAIINTQTDLGPPPAPSVTPTPTPSPTPTDTPGENRVWGDANCSGSAGPVDSLLTLRHDAGLSADTGDCPAFGQVVEVANASPHPWGDIDCSGEVTPVDSLKLLRHDAGLGVAQEPNCPLIGSLVRVTE